VIDSHHAGLAATVFPASDAEHRLRGRAHRAADGAPFDDHGDAAGDPVVHRGLQLRRGRGSDVLTEYDGDLSGTPVPPLDGVVSPSRLEAWAACPHAYFGRYLLDVDPVEEPDDQIRITARDRGTAHHAALDLFHRAVVDGSLPQPDAAGWHEVHRRALVEFFDEVCERTERRGRTGRAAFWADERSLMLDDLLTWLARDSALVVERGSVVLASELRFGLEDDVSIALPDGRPIRLRGSIDRVDRTRDGRLVVTDHKSGGAEKYRDMSPADPTVNGTLFQLPSYAAAARARFGEPTTPVLAEYGLLRKGGYARPGFDVTPEVDALVSASLARIVSGIETGWFPHVPDPPGRYFVNCLYCEPDGLGTVERWSDWERKRHDPRLAAWFGDDEVAT
jgi:RecB family exonuclease